jgi:hypothetical protein
MNRWIDLDDAPGIRFLCDTDLMPPVGPLTSVPEAVDAFWARCVRGVEGTSLPLPLSAVPAALPSVALEVFVKAYRG